jgi:hypothetical protein
MKLTPIALSIIARNMSSMLIESAEGDAKSVQNDLKVLSSELQADGEDITDEEVQAAMLSALIDADGDLDKIDVTDIESVKTEIKESRGYITEDEGIFGVLHLVGDVLGNAAFLEKLDKGLNKIGIDIDEKLLEKRLKVFFTGLKKVTGFPAKMMEKFFDWVAKKFGASAKGQEVAGISGTLLVILLMFAIGIALFPSISSVVLMTISLTSLIGKSVEIVSLTKELIHLMSGNHGDAAPALA